MVIKKFLLSAAFCLCAAACARAQGTTTFNGGSYASSQAANAKTFIICMTDTNMIQQSSSGTVYSTNIQVWSILNNYTVYSIEKAYPASRFLSMRSYYRIRANSLDLMQDLLGYSAGWFPDGYEERRGVPLFEPAEFFNGSGCDTFLRYVKAHLAWDYTRGKPEVVIGISDTYFDLTNPDLAGRIDRVRYNTPPFNLPPGALPHGTEVSGFAVCNTNDDYTAGIGWECRLDVSSNLGVDGVMLDFSAGDATSPPRKIINGSWMYPSGVIDLGYVCNWAPGDVPFPREQRVYNEIYENGATAVFAAGNSYKMTPRCGMTDDPSVFEEADVQAYAFPASFDHVLSISGIGSGPRRTTFNTTTGAAERLNWADMHCLDAQNPATAMHHNDRVDLLAPAYFMPALYYDPNDASRRTTPSVAGTSYSAPMIAGTVALMQSVAKDQCLSPYQVEYLLKTNANTEVFNKPENAAYAGMLGAGVLNVEAAVINARYIAGTNGQNFCNDPATQTFIVKRVDLNTTCAPGYASNGVLPRLKVVLENGTPPYTYQWVPMYGGNSGTLDAYDIPEPTVTGTGWDQEQNKPRITYWLRVEDSSPLPKVANAEVIIYFRTSGYDLAMRDGPMDMYSEPYRAGFQDSRERIWWNSPDIWNRRVMDGGLDHQDPEYYDTDSNYLHTRIRNVGCEAAPADAKLRLYWTIQSTGEKWAYDWTQANFPGNPNLPAGRELTNTPMDIPVLQPGEEALLVKGWRSQRPSLYGDDLTELNACVLARIEESPVPPYGMAYAEQTGVGVGENVKKNNNIVTRNLTFADLLPGNEVPASLVIVGNPFDNAVTYSLQLLDDKSIRRHLSGDFSAIGFVRIKLGAVLYDRWMKGGGRGNYAARDDRAFTVDYGGSGMLNLEGIELQGNERIPITLQFIQREDALTTGMDYTFHLQQIMGASDAEMPDTDPLTGGVTFTIHTQKTERTISETGKHALTLPQNISVYPNPAADKLYITCKGADQQVRVSIADITGRTLLSRKQLTVGAYAQAISLRSLKAGVYIITVTDARGKANRFKIVKR